MPSFLRLYHFQWRGQSDTETLLGGFDAWGIKETINKTIGMFAFAVFDRKKRKLIIGRDRLGEKPLYYGWQGQGTEAIFIFGSELVSLRQHPAFNQPLDRGAIALLMRHNYIPAPHSIFQNIYKVQPGHLCTVSLESRTVKQYNYWNFADIANKAALNKFEGSAGEAVDNLEEILMSSIKQQMISDVPLGAFLSGGIDSSTIVALMQAQSDSPVKTFSIGFNEDQYNEADYAKEVARHLRTDHTELFVTAKQSQDVISNLASLYNEPFADSSQIPTFLVSQLAKQNVTVSLSGDGGDELFCGYNRYVITNNIWQNISRLPISLRSVIASTITSFSPQILNKIFAPLQRIMPNSLRFTNFGDKLHKGAGVLNASDVDQLYLRLVSQWSPETLVLNSAEPATVLNGKTPQLTGNDIISRMMALDTMSYLPDDILVKVDRATMGVSLEGRMPFLDHRVVEFAWSLPNNLKLNKGVSKWVLRQVLYRHVPKTMIERPKMGFGIPIDKWLRGPLREWAESLINFKRIDQEGYFNATELQIKWKEHLSGKRNWSAHLWNVLMFQAWIEENNL